MADLNERDEYSVIPPPISDTDVPSLVEKHYGLTPTSVRKLDGYDDCNFLLNCDGDAGNVNRNGYVFKVINAEDSANPELIDGFIKALLHCSDRGVNCPVPRKNIHDGYVCLESLLLDKSKADGETSNHLLFVLSYIPGEILGKLSDPVSRNLAFELGENLVALDDAFRDKFHHDAIKNRVFRWDMQQALLVKKYLHLHKDEENDIMTSIIDAFEEDVVNRLPNLPRGFIHGDFNDYNILVDVDKDGVQHYLGIIDFCDISYSRYVFELGTTLMYIMMYNDDPISTGGHVIAGYCTKYLLNDDEWSVLPIAVAARFAMSLTYGKVAHVSDPDNKYVLCTQAKGWETLKKFWAKPRNEIIATWKSIVESYQNK